MIIDPAMVEKSTPSAFSDNDFAAALKAGVTFMAEEGIDSTLNGNPTDKANIDAWWERNKGKIYPSSQAVFSQAVHSMDRGDDVLVRGLTRGTRYGLAYGGDKSHVLTRAIKPTNIRETNSKGKPAINIHADVTVEMAAIIEGKQVAETTEGSFSYIVAKEPATGKWLIDGIGQSIRTETLSKSAASSGGG